MAAGVNIRPADTIPRRIFSIWLGDAPQPPLVQRCLKTHQLPGYEHRMITSANCDISSRYVRDCLVLRQWVKAADYLRILYLHEEGGIYLDADVEVLPGKGFDDLLHLRAFCGREESKFWCIANSVIGARAGHPTLKAYLDRVDRECRPDDGRILSAGMDIWGDVVYADRSAVTIMEPTVFFPFEHITRRVNQTEETRTWHHFLKSWTTGA